MILKYIKSIVVELIPVVVMIGTIPIIKNDYLLLLVYIGVITVALSIKYNKWDFVFFWVAMVVMTIAESFFILTEVEVFERSSLLGIMPIWLPVLWAYVFIVMRRIIRYIEHILVSIEK